ncbi:MAG: cytochrome [Hydrocarboniphaga sp.]|uniref:cytochrome P450 n=1 Tax=Hydrocarboniphaga sp. TaxID=2033016 RepID=UPI00260E7CAC|nr:cytochrome P450 [Hydrocarboniphaga sp.]MDB5970645.1 cytochrome [Hydrocarboniphaga sp.]
MKTATATITTKPRSTGAQLIESWQWTASQIGKGIWLALNAPREISSRPDHVPADRVVDFDFANMEGAEVDVHAAWKRLHDGPSLFWTPRKGGHWVVTRAELIDVVLRDPETFSSNEVILPRGSKPLRLLPIEANPPDHQHYRALVMTWFTPKAVAAMKPGIHELTVEIIDAMLPNGRCEFISECAKRLPIAIFLKLVNLPMEDREKLLDWTETAVRSKNALHILSSFLKTNNYIEGWIRKRRAEPGNDLFSAIVNGSVQGRPLTHAEIQGMLTVILFGGLDTVAAMLAFMTKFLAENPGHRQQLIEHPDLIPGAIDELMRRYGIVNLSRLVARDCVMDGVRLKKGDMIHIPNGLYGVDERRHVNPLAVDFTAPFKADRHASFGLGIHRCAGALLARMELAIFLEEWLKRIPEFSIAPGEQVRTATGQVNGVTYLPLVWKTA